MSSSNAAAPMSKVERAAVRSSVASGFMFSLGAVAGAQGALRSSKPGDAAASLLQRALLAGAKNGILLGAKMGAGSLLYFAAEGVLAAARNSHDLVNSMCGGVSTGAMMCSVRGFGPALACGASWAVTYVGVQLLLWPRDKV